MIERVEGHLHVKVPMTLAHADALVEAGRNAFRGKREVVDLVGVSEVDSSALAVLLAWLRSAQVENRFLLLINAPDSLRALVALYGVEEILALA